MRYAQRSFYAEGFSDVCCMMNQGGSAQKAHLGLECFLLWMPLVMTDAISPDLLPMRDVVSLTGINPVTLRAWERRHGLISPQRTEGGHRLYTARDVQRIRDILRWTGNGVPISKVGERLAGQPEVSAQQLSAFDQWRASVARASRAFDATALEGIHGQLYTLFPTATVLRHVLMPVWHDLAAGAAPGERSQWLFSTRSCAHACCCVCK